MDALNGVSRTHRTSLRPSLSITVCGTGQQIVTSSSRNFRQRPDGAGNHGLLQDYKAAGSNCSANVFVGNDGNFAGTLTENALHQLFGIAGSDRQFFGKEPHPGSVTTR